MAKVFGSFSRLVSLLFRKDGQDVTLRPNQSTTYTAARDVQLPPGDASHVVVSEGATQTLTNKTLTSPVINTPTGITKSDVGLGNVDNTSDATKNSAAVALTNKTIDADLNTITNIENADIKVGAAIDAAKIHDGSVSNTEFGYLNGVTSAIQTQLTTNATAISDHLADATDAHDASAISNVPSGNLAATDVQGALNELQTDVDTRATSAALTAHTGASSGVHGVTGSVVGTTDTQSLTNKTFDNTSNALISGGNNYGDAALSIGNNNSGSLARTTLRANATAVANIWGGSSAAANGEIDVLGTAGVKLPAGTSAQRPSSPAAGHIRLNTDTNEFEGYANGAWQSVGGGVNEQPLKNYLKSWATATVGLGTVSNGTVSATGNRTTDTTSWASTNTADLTAAQSSDTTLRGSFNYLTSGSGNSATGGTFLETPVFTLEGSDLGKPVSISFDVAGNTTSGDWDVAVVRYNSSGTYQETIPVAGTASTATVASARIPTGTAQFRGFFVTGSTSTDRYALRFRRLANAVNIRLDTLYVGPQVQLAGAPVTDWQSYTPTFGAGFGTVTGVNFEWRQVGSDMQVRGTATAGTVSAGASTISIPNNSISSTEQNRIVGISTTAYAGAAGTYNGALVFVPTGATTTVSLCNVGNGSVTRNLSGQLVNEVMPSSTTFSVNFSVKIANWSSNVTMAERAVEEYAWNSSSSTTATDTTSFANGASGALIRSITASLIRRVRFQTPILATDNIFVEVSPDQQRWFPISNGYTDNVSFSVCNFQQQNTTLYGLGYPKVINSTDVDVNFGQYSDANGATYAAAGRAWSAGGGGLYWRVRKVSGGAAVGYPVGARNVVGDTTGTAVPAGMIGERVLGTFNSGSFTTNTPRNIATLTSLPPGVWMLVARPYISTSGTPGANSYYFASISTTSATQDSAFTGVNMLPSILHFDGVGPYLYRYVNISTATTYYLVATAVFTSSTETADSRTDLFAVRIA